MLKDLIIREEKPDDYKAAEHMTMRSFWNKYRPGCTEHLLVRILRESEDYIPKLSRVAELNGMIAGAVYYTRAWIVNGDTRHEIVTFGPLAVEPTMEGHDIGGQLLRETIRLAKEAGIAGIVIIGEPYYYPRFGFRRGAEFGITDEFGNSFDALMVLPLNDDFSSIKGKLIESEVFEKADDIQRQEEMNKEFPLYRKVKVMDCFMQIFEQHLGVVDAIEEGRYIVRYWELRIPAVLSEGLSQKPVIGSDIQFKWRHNGESVITKVITNLLEE